MASQKNIDGRGRLVFGLMIALVCSLMFQNCSPFKSNSATNISDAEIKTLSDKTVKLNWSKNNGSVSPAYQYQLNYEFDFINKTFKLTVNKGVSVTDQPAPQNKILTDPQVLQIKNLISLIKVSSCSSGNLLIGGGAESLGVYTSSSAINPDRVIYGSDCTGLGTNFYQANSGYSELIDYLKSL
jgi:hypothetical protein